MSFTKNSPEFLDHLENQREAVDFDYQYQQWASQQPPVEYPEEYLAQLVEDQIAFEEAQSVSPQDFIVGFQFLSTPRNGHKHVYEILGFSGQGIATIQNNSFPNNKDYNSRLSVQQLMKRFQSGDYIKNI